MNAQTPLLQVTGLAVSYGGIKAVKGIDLEVARGEMVCLIGANGAGKTSTLKAIAGLLPVARDSIRFESEPIGGRPAFELVRRGLALVPEGRGVFSQLTVVENLAMGAYIRRDHAEIRRDLGNIFDLFPRLKERRQQTAGTLSGGEQQMLAIARALMARPRLLLLDEPSLGLAPLIVKQIFAAIKDLNEKEGLTVFLVEQNAFHALKLAHQAYVMVNGNITMSGTGKELLARPEIRAAYLEGSH